MKILAKSKQSEKMPQRVSVHIGKHQGKYRLSFTTIQYGRKKMSTGLDITPDNLIRAEKLAELIEKDVAQNLYSPGEHSRYKKLLNSDELLFEKKKGSCDSLYELFKTYGQFRKENREISPGTYRSRYLTLERYLEALEDQDPLHIYDQICRDRPADFAGRQISLLRSAFDWAVMRGIMDHNPYSRIKVPGARKKKPKGLTTADPFTLEEMRKIIQGFENSKDYKYYANFIRFLFLTGMRPGEAVAVYKEDIKPKHIKICRSQKRAEKGYENLRGLKTEEQRNFPINKELEKVITRAVQSSSIFDTPLLFPGPKGNEIARNNLNNRGWKKVLSELDVRTENKYTGQFRSLKTTRHTFITLSLLNNVAIADVAGWVGNSIAVIESYYSNLENQGTVPPSFF